MAAQFAKVEVKDGSYYKFNRLRIGREIGKEISAKAARQQLVDKNDVYTPAKSDAKQLAKKVHKGRAAPDEAHKRGYYAHFHPAGEHEEYGHVFYGEPS